jgi:hypothetical protein
VTSATRETLNTCTIIDLVFSNDKNIKNEVSNHMNITDHNFIKIDINYNCKKDHGIQKYVTDWTNYSKQTLIEKLHRCNWDEVYDVCNINKKAI